MNGGKIRIETELATDKFDRQVANLQKKIDKAEDKKVEIEANIDVEQSNLDAQRQKVDELAEAYQRVAEIKELVEQGKATPEQFSELQQLGSLDKLGQQFDTALTKQTQLEGKVENLKNKYEAVNKEVAEYNNQIKGVELAKHNHQVEQMKKSFDGVGSSIERVVKKAGRLALSIFGIRSAYMLLRRASSDLAGYDEQYATNLEYIRYVLTQAVAPILKWIVDKVMQLLQLINSIVYRLFGVNLFARGSAESFNKMKKGADGVNKAVKQIKKQLTGFDEINVLSDTSDTGTQVGSTTKSYEPPIDLSKVTAPKLDWMEWIKKNWKKVALGILGIVGAFTALKLIFSSLFGLNPIAGITGLFKALGKAIELVALLGGLALVIASVGYVIKQLTGLINAISKSGMKMNDVFDFMADLIIGLIALMTTTVVLAKFLSTNPMALVGLLTLTASISAILLVMKETLPTILDAISKFAKEIAPPLIATINAIIKAVETAGNIITKVIRALGDVFDVVIRAIGNVIDQVGNTFLNVLDGIIRFVNDLGDSINKLVDDIIRAVTKLINFIISAVEYLLNIVLSPLKGVSDLLQYAGFNVSFGQVSIPRFAPKLASGGIVNMPNRGTLLGNAIVGESGAEGVIPLTDEQAMSTLGEAIGRHVNIQANIINKMNGRLISRQLVNVENNQAFAYNG